MENSAHENKKDAFLYKQHVMTGPHLLDMSKPVVPIKQYIIIWKDKHGNIHRTEHFQRGGLGYLMWYYSPFPNWWIDDVHNNMHFQKPDRELLYIFKQK